MNFNELYRKIAEIDKRPTSDIAETCGMSPMSSPMSSPMPQQDNVNMNVNMSGSGAGGIRDLMAILKNIEDGDQQQVSPSIAGGIGISGDMDSTGGDELAQMLRLTGQDDGSDSMSDKEIIPGNDNSSDGPELDDEPKDESFVNEPDENYNDVGAVTTDAGGGLNGSKQQIKHGSTPGNNPLPESVKQRLQAKYQQYK